MIGRIPNGRAFAPPPERFAVTLPNPRRLAMRETAQFVELAGHLRRVLESC